MSSMRHQTTRKEGEATLSTATALLKKLSHLGIRVEASGERLKVHAPPGALTDDLRAALAAHKQELLKLLRGERNESQQAYDEGGRAPYRVLVNGRVGAEAHTKDEAVRVFDDAIRGIGPTETTVTVEIVDDEGKRLRVAYFPPWPG